MPTPHALFAAFLALVLAAASAQAAGTVQVSFIEPESYLDAGRGTRAIEHTTQALSGFLTGLAAQLPDGQSLSVEVTDIDLAGELRQRRFGFEVRVLRGRVDWPRISLRWTLFQDGRVVKSAHDHLADMNYLLHSSGLRSHEEFSFERRMLERWFSDNFAPPAKAP